MGIIEEGDLDWQTDEDGNDGVRLQVDGNDVVSISDVMTDGKAHIIVWSSSHPDATIAWEGYVNVRERACPADCSEETYDPGVACSECGKVWKQAGEDKKDEPAVRVRPTWLDGKGF